MKVPVCPTSKFLSWRDIQERIKTCMPVSVSVMEKDGTASGFGCIPVMNNGVIRLGSHISSSGQKINDDLISMAPIGGRKVSVMEGEFISRVLVRDLSQAALFRTESVSTQESRGFFVNQLGDLKLIHLFIDEPVDPSGRRCLYCADDRWGGADLDWVIAHSVANLAPHISLPSVERIPHINSTVELSSKEWPSDLHGVRMARAPHMFELWGKKSIS